ncbi:21811_t:CDS:2, partial [Cetraspora pellucida]
NITTQSLRRRCEKTQNQHDLSHMNIECIYCNALHWQDEHLMHFLIKNSKFGLYCQQGKIKLSLLNNPLLLLRHFFESSDKDAKEFCANIRQYNAAHAFTSLAHANNTSTTNLTIYLHYNNAIDRHCYNLPTMDEIAIILSSDGSISEAMCDIVIHLYNNKLKHIQKSYPAYLSLYYVLLFLYGELGWHEGLCQSLGNIENNRINNQTRIPRLTQKDFFSFHLFAYHNKFLTILRGGKLFQEFIIDAWATTEQNRLRFLYQNQDILCADLYQGLADVARSIANSKLLLNNLNHQLLLTVVCGPQSFDHLKMINSITYPTFKDACIILDLLENDNEWNRCLEEAAIIRSGAQLRSLFATILVYSTPTNPQNLWLLFYNNLCNDFHYQLHNKYNIQNSTELQIFDLRLFLLDQILYNFNYSLNIFPLMPCWEHNWDHYQENYLIYKHLNWNHNELKKISTSQELQLNTEQHAAYQDILNSVDNDTNMFKSDNIIEIPQNMTIESELNSLIKSVYCNISIENICTDQYLKDRIILSSCNTNIDDINITILNSFPENQKMYLSSDKIVSKNNNNFNNFYSTSHQGLCNSSRLIVTRLNDYVIEARILTGDHAGNLTFIPYISLTTSTFELLFKLKQYQFPINVAFAITINKSQDQFVKHVGISHYIRNIILKSNSLYKDAKVFTIWAIGIYPTGHENNEIEITLFLSVNSNNRDPKSQAIFKKDEYYSIGKKIIPGSYAGQIRPKITISTSTHLTISDKEIPSLNKCPLKTTLIGIPQEIPAEIENTENSIIEILVSDYIGQPYNYTIK